MGESGAAAATLYSCGGRGDEYSKPSSDYVGECRDLIFGVSLVDYATARGLPEGEVPKIIRICIQDIEQRGLDAEGIYRVKPYMWSSLG